MSNVVCVLLPHYNNTAGLEKSIAGIGSDEKVDVVVVDDGSSERPDETKVTAAAAFPGRVFFRYLPENRGIAVALNEGLAWIKQQHYTYVARLDCGDVCAPRRFQKQQAFLERHPDVALAGTWARYVDTQGEEIMQVRLPTDDGSIRKKLFLYCMFIHPSIMFRTCVLEQVGGYDPGYRVGEDYPFYFEVLKRHRVANLPEFLLTYEVSAASITGHHRRQIIMATMKTILHNFYWGIYPVAGLLKNLLLLTVSRGFVLKIRKKWQFYW